MWGYTVFPLNNKGKFCVGYTVFSLNIRDVTAVFHITQAQLFRLKIREKSVLGYTVFPLNIQDESNSVNLFEPISKCHKLFQHRTGNDIMVSACSAFL